MRFLLSLVRSIASLAKRVRPSSVQFGRAQCESATLKAQRRSKRLDGRSDWELRDLRLIGRSRAKDRDQDRDRTETQRRAQAEDAEEERRARSAKPQAASHKRQGEEAKDPILVVRSREKQFQHVSPIN